MSLTREQMLEEMGLGPVWRLRAQPVVGAVVEEDIVVMSLVVPLEAALVPENNDKEIAKRVLDPLLQRPTSFDPMGDFSALDWPQLYQTIASCQACGLCREREQTVPGIGDVKADWLFIGDAPSVEDDQRGEPFVGQSGQLLNAMLAAIDLKRGGKVYLANTVKCRPPAGRPPEADEIERCWPYLKQQIALLRPKLIVLLGRTAMLSVLKEERALSSSRGTRYEYHDGDLVVPVIVTYHPDFLLRNLPDKSKSWEDLCFARRVMRGE